MKLFLSVGMTVLIAFFVCGSPFCTYYENIAHKITEKTAKKLQEEKDLRLMGTGGRMMDNIKQMDMSFYFYHEADLEMIRSLMVYVIDEYLSEINSNKEIKPYLHEVPFTAKNVEIDIFFYNSDRSELPQEKIYCATSINGILEYYVRSDPYNPVYKETYDQARLALLQKAK